MSKQVSKRIISHQYPSLYLRYPFLIHLNYFWFRMIYQRVGVTYKYLEPYLEKMPNGSVVTDAGFGEGQFLFRYVKRFKNVLFEGLDYNENPLLLGGCYKEYFNLKNVQFQQLNLINWQKTPEIQQKDGILCVGVLHYITEDDVVLKNFYDQLKTGGWLLIYTPLQARTVLNLYRKTLQRFKNYDQTYRIQEYKADELIKKIQKTGFSIVEKRFTHGTMGILSYELYTIGMTYFTQGRFLEKIFGCFFLLFVFPFILIFKQLDMLFYPKTAGNALLIVVEK